MVSLHAEKKPSLTKKKPNKMARVTPSLQGCSELLGDGAAPGGEALHQGVCQQHQGQVGTPSHSIPTSSLCPLFPPPPHLLPPPPPQMCPGDPKGGHQHGRRGELHSNLVVVKYKCISLFLGSSKGPVYRYQPVHLQLGSVAPRSPRPPANQLANFRYNFSPKKLGYAIKLCTPLESSGV